MPSCQSIRFRNLATRMTGPELEFYCCRLPKERIGFLNAGGVFLCFDDGSSAEVRFYIEGPAEVWSYGRRFEIHKTNPLSTKDMPAAPSQGGTT